MGIAAVTGNFIYGMVIPAVGFFIAAIGAIWIYEHNARKSKRSPVLGQYSKPKKRKTF